MFAPYACSIIMHALSNLSLRKKRKDEEFFYLDDSLDVENSNIL